MKFKALYLFAGIGGGALGFQQAREEWKGVVGTVETLAGITFPLYHLSGSYPSSF
jgi:hypothetical protein